MSQADRVRAFPLVAIRGGPLERGIQYGVQARPQILIGIANYKAAFSQQGVAWETARAIAAKFVPRLEAEEPRLLAEVRGIAQGAEVDFEEILALNARTEILYHGRNDRVLGDGCTAAAVLPEVTAANHLLHGQNWDWRDECTESTVILRVEPDSGPRMLLHVEAGILARCGFNEHGIALTGNFLKCDRDHGTDGIPIPFVRRRILESRHLSRAMSQVYDSPRSFSSNLMLSSRDGEAVNFEATPGEVFWTLPEDGLLVHANHFVCPAARAKLKDLGLQIAPDSLFRQRRVHARLKAKREGLEMADLQAAFSDRTGSPFSVCSEPETGPGGDTSATVATILMDTTELRMWVAPRPYAEHTYSEYRL